MSTTPQHTRRVSKVPIDNNVSSTSLIPLGPHSDELDTITISASTVSHILPPEAQIGVGVGLGAIRWDDLAAATTDSPASSHNKSIHHLTSPVKSKFCCCVCLFLLLFQNFTCVDRFN